MDGRGPKPAELCSLELALSLPPPRTFYISTMGDANGNQPLSTINSFFGQKNGKRPRTQTESVDPEDNQNNSNNNLLTPTPSTTDASLSSVGSTNSIPEIRLNNVDVPGNTSIQSITTPSRLDKDKERLAFKLDKLNDKRGRYESHVNFLRKCVDNNLTPNGLKVYVEPSIGNRDEAFLQKWHERLSEFSKILTNDVIEYSEATIRRTSEEIKETADELKALVAPRVYTDIEKTISNNEKSRNDTLTQRKNRKFYRLKYGDRNEQRSEQRNDQRNDRNQVDRRPNVILSNRGHRGMSRNNNSNDETYHYDRNVRNEHRYQRETNHENSGRDHNDRVIATIERRNARLGYADAVKTYQNRDGDSRNHREGDQTPIHEKIALNRKPSRRNTSPGDNNNHRRVDERDQRKHDHDPREGDGRNKHHGMDARNPREGDRTLQNNNKDREIEALRRKINELETGRNERIINHYTKNDENDLSKNANGAQDHQGPSQKMSPNEMQMYIKEALNTISAFATQLGAQTGSAPTPTDK